MKRTVFALLVPMLLPLTAQAEDRMNALGLTLDPLMADTESPAGDRDEKHGPRFGLEYARTVWPRLDLFFGAGAHRIRLEEAGAKTRVNLYDIRLGARQYFLARQVQAWSPFVELAVGEAWVRNEESTVGDSRRYDGWSAALGAAKRLSENTDLRFSVGYQRMRTDDKRNDYTDVYSTAELRAAVMVRY